MAGMWLCHGEQEVWARALGAQSIDCWQVGRVCGQNPNNGSQNMLEHYSGQGNTGSGN